MSLFLLLEDTHGNGIAEELLPERSPSGKPIPFALGPQGRELDFKLKPNDDADDVLHNSARRGGGMAYELLWREKHLCEKVTVRFHFKEQPPNVQGHSGDLLFALAAAVALMQKIEWYSSAANAPALAATGVLDEETGDVTAVQAVPAKLRAALAKMPNGGLFFCPTANYADIDAPLRQQAQAQGVAIHPLERLEDALETLGIKIEKAWLGEPYRGLRDFEYSDHRIFFGRQHEIGKLCERLLEQENTDRPGIVILGGSGAGKSSLVQAGLFHALTQGPRAQPERPASWAVWRPGDAPAKRDEAALARSIHAGWVEKLPEELADLAAGDSLHGLADALAAAWPAQRRLVWLVDQFEELFTLGFAAEAINAFVDFLRRLQNLGVWLVATLRNDFYPQYQQYLLKTFAVYDLPPLDSADLDEIINGPAKLADLKFEDQPQSGISLAMRLREDMTGRAAALPLLEFVLDALYERRHQEARLLTWAAYEASGGLPGAIGRHADRVYAALDKNVQATLPALLWRLTVPGHEAGKIVSQALPLDAFPADGPARQLVDGFVQERLLVLDGADGGKAVWLRVAHDALLEHWPLAKTEIAAFSQDMPLHERLKKQAALWRQDGEAASRLLPAGLPLQEAADLLERRRDRLEADVAGLVEASIAAESARRQAEWQTQRRRTRVAWTVAAVLGMLLAVAGGFGYLADQRQQAANYHRGEAEKLIDFMLFDLRSKLQPLGRLDLLDRVVKQAEDYFKGRENASIKPDDYGLHQRVGAATSRGNNLSEQGDLRGALAAYRQAMEISQILTAKDPGNADWQRDLSISHEKFGNVLTRQSDLLGALGAYRQALAINLALAAKNPGNNEWQRDLAVSHSHIGDILAAQRDKIGALESYRQALTINQTLAAKTPDEARWQYGLSVSHEKIGNVFAAQEDWPGALAEYRQAMEIRLTLVAKDPENAEWRKSLSLSQGKIGEILYLQKNLPAALSAYRQYLETSQALATQDPSNAAWQRDLSVGHSMIGKILSKQNDLSGALAEYRQDLEISQALAAKDPNNMGWQVDLSISHETIGELLEKQNNLPDALAAYRQADAVLSKCLNRLPRPNAQLNETLTTIKEKWAFAALLNKHYAEALSAAESALTINPRLLAITTNQAHALLFLNHF